VERDDAEWQLAGTARPAGEFSRAAERVSGVGFADLPTRPPTPSGRPAGAADNGLSGADLSGAVLDLLAAATAPAHPHELAGEDAALAAFRRPGRAPVRKPRRRALLAKLLTVKVAAAFAVSAAGGVAVAAAAGTLPDLPGRSGITARPEPPAPPPAWPRASRPASRPGPAAPPSLTDLCRTWAADQRHRLDGKAYGPLVSAAGGRKKVPAYCADLLAKAGRDGSPTPTAKPGGHRPGGHQPDGPKGHDPKGSVPKPKDEKTRNPKPRHLLPTDHAPSSPAPTKTSGRDATPPS
jgi:hypothetical protein